MLLGCVADDLTGATDLADTLVRAGLRTTLLIGPPDGDADGAAPGSDRPLARGPADGDADGAAPGADRPLARGPADGVDAVVVALRSRTAPASSARAWSLAALRWLRSVGAARAYFFKVCSTFDSTDEGNIGPVADALADSLGATVTVVCPAFPANGRTVYAGHLFVGDVLISRSSMAHHPLTPMTDPDLVAVLGRQSRRPVALAHLALVREGAGAVERHLRRLAEGGPGHVVADAVVDADLDVLGRAAVALGLPLCVGGSGLAGGLARALAPPGGGLRGPPAAFPAVGGPAVIVSGSCSAATQAQVAAFVGGSAAASSGAAAPAAAVADATAGAVCATGEQGVAVEPGTAVEPGAAAEPGAAGPHAAGPHLAVDPLALPDDLARLEAELVAALGSRPVLVSSTATAERVAAAQRALGPAEAAARVESALGHLARVAVDAGARRVLVAGGETAGAVIAALGVTSLEVGPAIAVGVPWTAAELPAGGGRVALALKSGNFGRPDFFSRALAVLDGREPAG